LRDHFVLEKIEKKVRKIDIEFRKHKKSRKIQAKNQHLVGPKKTASLILKLFYAIIKKNSNVQKIIYRTN